jgi:hypothetical protein
LFPLGGFKERNSYIPRYILNSKKAIPFTMQSANLDLFQLKALGLIQTACWPIVRGGEGGVDYCVALRRRNATVEGKMMFDLF